MELAFMTPRCLPSPLRCRIMVSQGPGHPGLNRCSLLSSSHHWKLTVKSSLNVPPAGQSGELNKVTGYMHMLSDTLWKSLPEPVKELPWKKATDLVFHRLIHLGKKALKWFLVGFLLVSFSSDVSFSLSRNMELLIPLGLFIGITVADFLVEISKELIQSTTKVRPVVALPIILFPSPSHTSILALEQDNGSEEQLLRIGTIFVCLNLVTRYVALPGRIVLSHMSSGGLLQALWLAKELQGTESEKDVESSVNVELQEPVA